MIGRLILKTIVVLTFAFIGIIALAVIGIFGYFFLALAFPQRMTVTGRVTDPAGRPLKAVEVRAVPLPVYDPYSEAGSMQPQDKEHITVTDKLGRFRFKRLIASGGVKEGMWMQEYDIVVKTQGYTPKIIRIRNDFEKHKDLITLGDLVLEEQTPPDKIFGGWQPPPKGVPKRKTQLGDGGPIDLGIK
jgi:hypothetical protein